MLAAANPAAPSATTDMTIGNLFTFFQLLVRLPLGVVDASRAPNLVACPAPSLTRGIGRDPMDLESLEQGGKLRRSRGLERVEGRAEVVRPARTDDDRRHGRLGEKPGESKGCRVAELLEPLEPVVDRVA